MPTRRIASPLASRSVPVPAASRCTCPSKSGPSDRRRRNSRQSRVASADSRLLTALPCRPMATFLDLAQARRGHFQMESGFHSGMWFDLDAAFADQAALDPFVTQLAQSLRRHNIEAVCGPLTGGAFLAQLLARLLGSEFYFAMPAPSDGQGMFSARYQLPAGI